MNSRGPVQSGHRTPVARSYPVCEQGAAGRTAHALPVLTMTRAANTSGHMLATSMGTLPSAASP